MFFQIHKDEIDELPQVFVDKMDLLPEILKKSRADSTSKKYELAFKRWKKWGLCNFLGSGDILPAITLSVAIYLSSLFQSAHTPAPLISAYYAIKWYHDIFGLKSPTDSKSIINIFKSGKTNFIQANKQEGTHYNKKYFRHISVII